MKNQLLRFADATKPKKAAKENYNNWSKQWRLVTEKYAQTINAVEHYKERSKDAFYFWNNDKQERKVDAYILFSFLYTFLKTFIDSKAKKRFKAHHAEDARKLLLDVLDFCIDCFKDLDFQRQANAVGDGRKNLSQTKSVVKIIYQTFLTVESMTNQKDLTDKLSMFLADQRILINLLRMIADGANEYRSNEFYAQMLGVIRAIQKNGLANTELIPEEEYNSLMLDFVKISLFAIAENRINSASPMTESFVESRLRGQVVA